MKYPNHVEYASRKSLFLRSSWPEGYLETNRHSHAKIFRMIDMCKYWNVTYEVLVSMRPTESVGVRISILPMLIVI